MSNQPTHIRIVILSDSAEVGGTERSLQNLVGALGDRFDVTVAGTCPDVVDEIASARATARRVAVPPVPDKRSIRAMLGMFRALARLRPAVFQINLTSPRSSRFFLAAVALMPGARVVVVEHLPLGATTWLSRRWSSLVERRIDAHVTVGETVARALEAERGLPSGRVVSIPNGVPEAAPAGPTPSIERPVVGCHARLVVQKGLDVLVRACAPLDCHVLIVGEGPERKTLEQLAVDLQMEDRLHLAGWQSDARSWLPAMDVYVLPSRFEGFPVSLVEAMMAGRPIVASDVGSVRDAVVPESTGLLVPADDVDALRRGIERLLGDEPLRERLGAEARARAVARYSVGSMAAAYERLYEEVAA